MPDPLLSKTETGWPPCPSLTVQLKSNLRFLKVCCYPHKPMNTHAVDVRLITLTTPFVVHLWFK
jgi:hypothetical protein